MVKNPSANAGDNKKSEFDPWVKKIPWRRKWQLTPVSCLENPMDGGAWWATVHGSQRVRHDWRTSLSLIAQIAPTLATGSPFCCFCVPLTNSRNFGSLALPYFLAQGDVPDSSCMFQDIALDSAISPSSSCCFYWKRVFKNQDLGWLCSMLLECCWV